jgi:hypothetical protein
MTRKDQLALEFVKRLLSSNLISDKNTRYGHKTLKEIAYEKVQAYLDIEFDIKYGTEPRYKVQDLIVSLYGTHGKQPTDGGYFMQSMEFHLVQSVTKGEQGWEYLLSNGNYTLTDDYLERSVELHKNPNVISSLFRLATEKELSLYVGF